MAKKVPHRLYLTEEQMPKKWYNLRADMKIKPDPLLNPSTLEPLKVEDLYPVFVRSWQTKRWIIPQGILIYRRKYRSFIKCTVHLH